MADNFKAFVQEQKKTNDKLEQLIKNDDEDATAKSRILDATPEIINELSIAKAERLQRDRLQKQDEKAEKIEAKKVKDENKKIAEKGNKNSKNIGDSLSKANEIEQGKIQSTKGSGAEESGNKTEKFLKGGQSFFGKMSKFMKGIQSSKFVSSVGSIWSKVLKAGLIGGTMLLLNFLTGPNFSKFYDTVVNSLLPAITAIYKFLAPFVKDMAGAVLNFLKDIGELISGKDAEGNRSKKTLVGVLWHNKEAVAVLVAALAPSLILGTLLAVPKLLKGAFTAVAAAFSVFKKPIVPPTAAARAAEAAARAAATPGAVKPPQTATDAKGNKLVKNPLGKFVQADPTGKFTNKLPVGKFTIDKPSKVSRVVQGAGKFVKGAGNAAGGVGKGFLQMIKNFKAFGPLSAIIGGVRATAVIADTELTTKQKLDELGIIVGESLGGLAGASVGAVLGAGIGTLGIPFVGTAVGGLIGAVLGGMGGAEIGNALVHMAYHKKLPSFLSADLPNYKAMNDNDIITKLRTMSPGQRKANPKMAAKEDAKVRKQISILRKRQGSKINSGSGNDSLAGGSGNDILEGGSGDDLLGANIQKRPPTFEELRASGGNATTAGTNIVNAPTSVVNNQSTQGIIGSSVSLTDNSLAAGMARHCGTIFA